MTQAFLRTRSVSLGLRRSPRRPPVDSPPLQGAKSDYALNLRGVSRVYPANHGGIRDVDLALRQGDFLFVTGPSGSGKTTLMKLIYGAEKPDQGEIWVAGENVAKLRGNSLSHLRRRLGVVFQDYKLIPNWTVEENVSFVLRAQGISHQKVRQRLLPTLKLVGLQDKAKNYPLQLSGGEQQRVSIARAIVGSPRLLLADEPTGNLDHENAMQVLGILKKLNSLGITVMVTTHDLNLIKIGNAPVAQINQGQLKIVSPQRI
ncbi:cell division ATP-binding protein FtsE [Lyngbya confervoides]|uniref:Cell division ATP-binding protein FtsE n=1 Tax=Lyngbya confervoides BDU141951 TaxID=1574623 RepID=A0ABD4T3W3_9CYAN|nr:cell division ATP-binding protein FtsE [Lyngbya confervoides]MCM1983130.1 cell division ATP-binding protein FtsE [Lyngbya confervoides BDU141951]